MCPRTQIFPGKLLLLLLACVGARAVAADRFVEDIRVSRTDGEAEVVIQLACRMRLVTDLATQSGLLLEIRVSPMQGCSELGFASGIASELYRPVGGHLAHLTEVEYESLGLGNNLLMLHFDRPVRYRISQRGDLQLLHLSVERSDLPGADYVPAPTIEPAVPPEESRRPAREPRSTSTVVRVRTPRTLADYIVNLQSTREPIDPRLFVTSGAVPGHQVYVSETALDGVTWYRLRIGFFSSEEEARVALSSLGDRFPRAWIGRAEAEEVRLASSTEVEGGSADGSASPVDDSQAIAAAPLGDGGGSINRDRVMELMSEARDATLDQDFDGAIRIYTRLLQEPGGHRQDAREFLGVAREKNGQIAHALAEYRSYLEEYPEAEGSERVSRRLDGLLTASAVPREPLRPSAVAGDARWDLSSGVSQYYRRSVNQFEGGREDVVSLSALMTDIDLSARRTGGTLDMMTRLTVSHFYDLLGEEDNGTGDQSRISYGYFDIADSQRGWSARVGRQSLHNWGVLGRFDGAHVAYEWKADRRVHLTTGHPVESTRHGVESDRQFLGVAVEFDNVIPDWDLSAFINEQTIEGIDARRAVGAEVRYQDESHSLTGMLDYDIDYGELNTLLALGTWRFSNRMTLSGLIDIRMGPVLTTRNALIGQPVTTIEELLLVWTEEEIRQLAVDRTAGIRTMTSGLSKPIGERFHLNVDVTTTEIEATVASGGVLAVPGSGPQFFYSTSVVGSGLFGTGDVNIINLRYGESDSFKSSYVTWDARFPIGRRVRLNPRLRVAVREGLIDGTKRETISPSLRLLINTRNHYRFELEVGSDDFTRTDANGNIESSGYYVNLGYRADF